MIERHFIIHVKKVIFKLLNNFFQKVQMSMQKMDLEIMLFILRQKVVFF